MFFLIYCFIYLFSTWSGPVNLSGLDVALRREIYWALADGEALLLSQSERERGVYYLDGCTAEEGGRLNISVTNRGSPLNAPAPTLRKSQALGLGSDQIA